MRRRITALVLVGSALGIVACEGNTDPASNIRATSAQLKFTGTANNGPAYTYFEYWRSSQPGTKFRTPTRNWPAGASGTYGERVSLARSTRYSFRVCGGDTGNPAVCRDIRSFTTMAAESFVERRGSVLEFRGEPGFGQGLSLSQLDATFRFDQWFGGAIIPGRGCGSVSGDTFDVTAICAASGVTRIRLVMRDGSDQASIPANEPPPATVDGGSGDDQLSGSPNADFLVGASGRDGLSSGGGDDTVNAQAGASDRDTIFCGAGSDTAYVDSSEGYIDEDCETVTTAPAPPTP